MTTNDNSSEPISRFWSKIGVVAELSSVFRNAPAKKETYYNALKLIQEVVLFDSAVLFLMNPQNHSLIQTVSLGDSFSPDSCGAFKPGFSEYVINLREPDWIADLNPEQSSLELEKMSALVVPLVVENSLIGTVVYVVEKGFSFRNKDIKLLSIIGDQMALSIERMMYQKQLESKNNALIMAQKELQEAQDSIIQKERLKAVRQLAVSVNHEINNPLSVITGNIEYLLYINKDLEEKTTNRLKIISNEALKIAAINRRLLEIQTLISESYLEDGNQIKMLNIDKSTVGEKNA